MTSPPKAFLCSQDGTHNFPLIQRITTIGKENCDIIITGNGNVDSQHALIEYIEDENCYILQDLNSSNGTYINDCRIQNATVRLVEQDTIRFGSNGIPFQFIVQSQFMAIPPINLSGANRQSNSQLQIINQTVPSRGSRLIIGQQSGVWCNNPLPNASLITINNQTQQSCQSQTSKPPATLRSRPISASPNSRLSNTKVNSWVKGYTNSNFVSFDHSGDTCQVDSETYRQSDVEISTRVAQLERELKIKSIEIRDLKEKLSFYQNQTNNSHNSTEIDQIKRDKSIAVGLVNTMQKDLSNKDSTISKLAREIEGYKRDIKEKDGVIRDLEEKLKIATDDRRYEEETQKKEKELIVLRTKFKTTENKIIDLTNQILHIKNELEESQRQSQKYIQTEKNLREELDHSKTQYIDMQRAERTVRIDLEQLKRTYEKFRNFIVQSIYSTPGVVRPPEMEVTDEFIAGEWKKIINERTNLVDTINSLKKKLSKSEEINTELISNLTSFELHLSQIEQKLISNGRRSVQIENELNSLKEHSTNEQLEKIKKLIIEIYTNELKWQTEIEETLKTSFQIDLNNNDSVRVLMLKLVDNLKNLNDEKISLENKLKESEESNKLVVVEELKKKEEEFNSIKTALETELKLKHTQEIEIIKKENEDLINLFKNDFISQINKLTEEKSTLSTTIENFTNEINSLKHELEVVKAADELHVIKEKLFKAEEAYKQAVEMYSKQIEESKLKFTESETNFSIELNTYKEQIKQHSLTIVNFEKEISRLREKEIEYLAKIEKLEKKIFELSIKKPASPKPPSPVLQKSFQESATVEITQLGRTIDLLRNEIQTYKTRITEQDELIKTLRRDLNGASAKLSDVHGEMTEKQKRELERNKQLVIEQQRELSDNRAQMVKLSEIVDKQTKQLDSLRVELGKSKNLVEKYKITSEENGALALELRAKLEDVECQLKKFDCIKKEEGKITNELTAAGAQCKGERHEQVIQRQREALNELRQRLKLLEQTRPAIPNHQQQMQQQIMLLKKQLAEVRASQALTEDIAKQANVSRGNDQSFLMLEEKTAHFETQTALDSSEESYLTLLRTISTILDITELDGLRSMCNLPPDERNRLLNERAKSAETICVKIKSLLDKLERKDQILKDYELDLAKLRQAEFLLQKKSDQLDDIQMFSRSKEDEIEYLKESLKNTKSDLEREKLLNAAIKQKKPLSTVQQYSERVRRESTDHLHHHCPPEDLRNNQVKKVMNEKLKRKDYELKTLKSELRTKSDELSSLTNRLTIVENNGQFK